MRRGKRGFQFYPRSTSKNGMPRNAVGACFQFYPRSTECPRGRTPTVLRETFNSIQDQLLKTVRKRLIQSLNFQLYPRSTVVLVHLADNEHVSLSILSKINMNYINASDVFKEPDFQFYPRSTMSNYIEIPFITLSFQFYPRSTKLSAMVYFLVVQLSFNSIQDQLW